MTNKAIKYIPPVKIIYRSYLSGGGGHFEHLNNICINLKSKLNVCVSYTNL